MAIEALPPATTRILNSSQVLTTPASLIKELLDNALDARASSIDIIISSNTLDKIEVRDNGHGIATDDLSALGRRGYTSKLRNFEELGTVGGLSLGFRGEALASAVELGRVTITTRTDGEAVATTVKLKSPGLIYDQAIVSHPIGTTVTVTDFLANLPVRKQTAQKESKKTLSAIRRMLQSYALARMNVRLNFRVHKTAKSNWSFAPRPNCSIREAVSQVIGPDTAAQCMEKTSTWNPGGPGCTNIGEDAATIVDESATFNKPRAVFIFQAFVAKPSADFSKIGGGHHVSIDSRPISCRRGPLKSIVAMYKTHVRATAGSEFADKLKDPFIRVNIVCPPGSYDPNVEPAKDDVIFENPSVLLASAGQWLKDVYGEPTPATSFNRAPVSMNDEFERRQIEKDASNAQRNWKKHEVSKRLPIASIVTPVRVTAHLSPPQTRFLPPQVGHSRHNDLQEDVGQSTVESWLDRSPVNHETEPECITLKDTTPPSKVANTPPPSAAVIRTRAKIVGDFVSGRDLLQETVPQQLPGRVSAEGASPIIDDVSHTERSRTWDFDMSRGIIEDLDPSDSVSQMAPRRSPTIIDDEEEDEDHRATLNPWLIAKLNASTNASSNLRRQGQAQIASVHINLERALEFERRKEKPLAAQIVTPLQEARVRQITHTDDRFDLQTRPRARQSNVPGDNSHINPPFRPPRQPETQQPVVSIEVDGALDYERRKEDATRKVRERLRAERASNKIVTSQARHVADGAPSQSTLGPAFFATVGMPAQDSHDQVSTVGNRGALTTLPDGDPRAYLIRRQRSLALQGDGVAQPKLKRTKTMLLPLESITEATRLNTLVHTVSLPDIGLVRKALVGLRDADDWVMSGKQALGLEMLASELSAMEKKIHEVVAEKLEANSGDFVLDLSGLRDRSFAVA